MFKGDILLQTFSAWAFCGFACLFIGLMEARAQTSSIVADSPASTKPGDSVVASKPVPALAFLMPAEGDVFYAQKLKLVVRVTGPVPSGLLAVLDGVWLDDPVQADKDVLSLELSGLKEGVHAVRLMYLDEKERIRSTQTVRFFVRLPEPPPPLPDPPAPPKLKQFGRVAARVEWKNDEAASRAFAQSELRDLVTMPETDTTYAYDTLVIGRSEEVPRNVQATVDASYGLRYERWEADVKGTLSTQENRFRQPVNRVSASVAYGPWAFARAGDIYPDYNPLIFSGTRLRGVEVGGAVVRGEESTRWAYAKMAAGESQRYVPAFIVRSEFNGAYDTAYVAGTHAQNVSALRLGAGGGDAYEAGVTLMKASEVRGDTTAENLNEYLSGPAPSENLVGGLDARAGFWEGRVQVYGQAALSFYTRDRSLGAFSTDTSASAFRPGKYRKILVINPTTSGWEFLVTDGETGPDYTGFLDAASAYTAGASASIPGEAVVWETDLRYDHLGMAYRSEGNPFLGGSPGNGWNLQQRLGFLENRLHFGAETSRFLQDFGDYKQLDRAVKGEVKFTTLEPQSAVWINAATSRQTPQGNAPYRYRQDFDELNLGGSSQRPGTNGTWNLFTQYGYTRGHFRILDPGPDDPVYPISYTHAVSTSVLYKFRDSDFIPKVSHTYSDNGVQKPAHSAGVGAQDAFLRQKLKVDGNVLVGQYARTSTRNGVSFGQNLALTYRFEDRQSLRFNEKSSHYGDRVSIITGANYERTF